ncbi:MAG TPA: hypothetical protein VHV78_13830 [Gemmatimonadaceae bacterium]|jgi:hypothetical protein|nr:hypothetical protein [Gemmatimonadaceae bacterium]
MRRFLAARRTACWLLLLVSLSRVDGAQTWNDQRTLLLVARAIGRRSQQLADTGLTDYQATAHGYVTFLAQLGEGFLTPPKIIKADELESEVYWHAPNLSKQIIMGRRDTLLLPTDIAYHRDHLGIIQNNFPNIIRIGEGDEVRDVPHPLSVNGSALYDYALTDSFSIGSSTQRVHVYEIKVRPKDDRAARVVGALYLDSSEGQIVRMNLSFTRAAFLDESLEELSVVLENRLVGGRFWLPSRQEIDIRRTGTWLDYPIRAIISGRWEIGNYRFNLSPPTTLFAGPEIIQLPPAALATHQWHGSILDSLPPDVRMATDEDIARVQAEARELVRAQALARAQRVSISARSISDFARVDRVEGLSVGDGLSKQFGGGISGVVRARYGIDDRQMLGSTEFAWTRPSGFGFRVFAMRDLRDVGDVAERSSVVNSLAAQEFGSDYTDPYLVRAIGLRADDEVIGYHWRLSGSYERQSAVTPHAIPVTGVFEPTIAARNEHAARFSLGVDRPTSPWLLGTELSATGELRSAFPVGSVVPFAGGGGSSWGAGTLRGVLTADIEHAFGAQRLVTATTVAGLLAGPARASELAPQELVYVGGPVSGPGYDYHAFVSNEAGSEHVEWQLPAPFVPFSLGRFGRVPAHGTLAPFVQAVVVNTFEGLRGGVFPSIGAGYLTPFDLIRFDVARGLRGGLGRWTFSVDVGRELWSIL